MATETIITIDVTDWNELRLALGLPLASIEDVIQAMMLRRLSALQMGAMLVAGRESGVTPADIIAPNKMILRMGAADSLMKKLADMKVDVATEFGLTIEVPAYMGGTTEEPGYVASDNLKAITRAEDYLLGPLMGHAWNRLAIIAGVGGDVLATIAAMKGLLDGLGAKLTASAEEEAA
jgi:hypothetical protein